MGDEQLAAIDDLVGGLQAATATYCDRPLDRGDVASLRRVREQLGKLGDVSTSASASAALSRAARQVVAELRPNPRTTKSLTGR